MAMLEDVKKTLRVTSTAFDTEVSDLIAACMLDLGISGVDTVVETDPLIKRAIITYCKAYFGYDNQDSDRLALAYDSLRKHLAISTDYHTYPVVEE